jgi:hypothetical protein
MTASAPAASFTPDTAPGDLAAFREFCGQVALALVDGLDGDLAPVLAASPLLFESVWRDTLACDAFQWLEIAASRPKDLAALAQAAARPFALSAAEELSSSAWLPLARWAIEIDADIGAWSRALGALKDAGVDFLAGERTQGGQLLGGFLLHHGDFSLDSFETGMPTWQSGQCPHLAAAVVAGCCWHTRLPDETEDDARSWFNWIPANSLNSHLIAAARACAEIASFTPGQAEGLADMLSEALLEGSFPENEDDIARLRALFRSIAEREELSVSLGNAPSGPGVPPDPGRAAREGYEGLESGGEADGLGGDFGDEPPFYVPDEALGEDFGPIDLSLGGPPAKSEPDAPPAPARPSPRL